MKRFSGLLARQLQSIQPASISFIRGGRRAMQVGDPELRAIRALVTPGTTAIDVGANTGVYSYAFSQYVGRSGLVISFEPIPHLAKRLHRAAKQLRLPIQVEECALSSQTGSAGLFIPVNNSTQLRGWASLQPHGFEDYIKQQVKLRRLDDYLDQVSRPISFIKIDVEGHESEVIVGAKALLAKHRPSLLVEIEQRHSTVTIQERFTSLEALGYQGYFLDAGFHWNPISEFVAGRHQAATVNNGTEKYINNFLFKPVEQQAGQGE